MEYLAQVPCPERLSALVAPLAKKLHLPTLPLHIHNVLGAFLAYHAIYLFISPVVAKLVSPKLYNNFPRRTQINWDVHVVSFVQSSFICYLALWGMWNDEGRNAGGGGNSSEDVLYRVFGYTVSGGAIQGYAAGYFLWDLMISTWYVSIMGWGFVAHALSALIVYSFGFRPFVNFYAPNFILFELSSPFLNIHWFCDKVGLTGSKLQLINGFALIATFFGCRIIWGTWNSILVNTDILSVLFNPPPATHPSPADLLVGDAMLNDTIVPHPFAGKEVPTWLAFTYLASNLVLNFLNYYWFSRMIQTVAARFKPAKGPKKIEDEKVWVEGTEVDMGTTADVAAKEAEELRRRLTAKRTSQLESRRLDKDGVY